MKLEVYDFDGTIYDGDSSVDFIKFLIKKNKRLLLKLPQILYWAIRYKMNHDLKQNMKEAIFSFVKEFNNIDELISEFWKSHEHNIKDFYNNKKTHKNDIIASASPIFLLEPIAKKYKIKQLFASPIDKHTGNFTGLNCHGVEKVRLINKYYPNDIIYTMYSDDIKADKPLLDIAKKSYVVIKNEIVEYNDYKNKNENIIKRFWNWGWSIYHKNEEIWNYLIVGGLTTVVSILTYFICVRTFLDSKVPIELQIANVISWIVAVLFAYVTNRKFVFKSKNKKVLKEMISFTGSRVITLLLDMFCMYLIVTLLKQSDILGKIVSQIVVIIGNYIISKLFVFKNRG